MSCLSMINCRPGARGPPRHAFYPPNCSSSPTGLVQSTVLARQHTPSSALLLASDGQAHRLLANLPLAPRHVAGSRPRGGGPLAPGVRARDGVRVRVAVGTGSGLGFTCWAAVARRYAPQPHATRAPTRPPGGVSR
eukprot:scaffold17078_cov65-Phaeocystis_antarctica.AAC.3